MNYRAKFLKARDAYRRDAFPSDKKFSDYTDALFEWAENACAKLRKSHPELFKAVDAEDLLPLFEAS